MSEKTIDLTNALSVLLVGLSDAEAETCGRAIRPIAIHRVATGAEACHEALRRRPLAVVMRADLEEAARGDVYEACQACGAEPLVLASASFADPKAVSTALLEALRKADKRRMAH
jgi:hypothetical protein